MKAFIKLRIRVRSTEQIALFRANRITLVVPLDGISCSVHMNDGSVWVVTEPIDAVMAAIDMTIPR